MWNRTGPPLYTNRAQRGSDGAGRGPRAAVAVGALVWSNTAETRWDISQKEERKVRRWEEGNGVRRGGRMSALVDRAQQSVAGGVDCFSRNPRGSFTSKLTTGKAGCWHLCRAASRHRKRCSKGGQALWPRGRTQGLRGYACRVDG